MKGNNHIIQAQYIVVHFVIKLASSEKNEKDKAKIAPLNIKNSYIIKAQI